MERNAKGTVGAPSNATQQKRSLGANAEIGFQVRQDDTCEPEKRGEPFAPSVSARVLDKHKGFGETKIPVHSHTLDKGLKTLNSDSRNDPLAGEERAGELTTKMDIHGRRRDEHLIGNGSFDENDINTIYGKDPYYDKAKMDNPKRNGVGFQTKIKQKGM